MEWISVYIRIELWDGALKALRRNLAELFKGARTRVIAVLVLLFLAGVLNCYSGLAGWPSLKIGTGRWDSLAFLLILTLPWLAFGLTMLDSTLRGTARRTLLIVLGLVMLVSVPASLFDLFLGLFDEPVVKTVALGGYRVRIHRLDGGPLSSEALGVDQERVLIGPMIISERLDIFDEADDAKLTVVGKNEIRVETLPYGSDQNIRVEFFEMKPFFLF